MFKLRNFAVFLEVILSINRLITLYRIGSFNKVITQIMIAGTCQVCSFGFEVTRLFSFPIKAGIFSQFGFIFESVDLADFSNDTSSIHRAYTWDA